MKSKSFLGKSVTLIVLAVFLFSGWKIGSELYENKHNRSILDDAKAVYTEQVTTTNVTGEVRDELKSLQQLNKDMAGWLTLDDTEIDYPILQSTDNDYYLHHNYKNEQARAGSIFKDYRNTNEFLDKNTIIYGHNMKDGSMFADLRKYLDKDFLAEHPTFTYESALQNYQVEIFAIYETTTDFYYIETEFPDKLDFEKYLQKVKQQSIYQSNVEVTEADRIITLSTCDTEKDYEKGRMVIQGKLVAN
ncbi:class B sortase [Listeria ivanovii]|uniref:Sortase B n=1 Tax=Listeria ivanovii (strain ATCC BAA-678 / PAM 55) TaxID=881621 RepID=G2ZE06_LISIP|nr:class B sortase [Listeria ivanovii]AHI56694.1 sortase [Listeria ivanovii WSLC3009]AIS66111.1 sortase [Listeria ivanovii subsp. ivanovii]MBC1760349.1 class B sortase [Listeria ivanovii]MBK3913867.1 class B sortase [Listeria ivanovii subsp. ivanovii]MBK3921295.1 class B sortase [Listeria ivanovii subsp. ivanovii]